MADRTRQAGAASNRIGDGADRPHPRQPLFHAAAGSAAARRREVRQSSAKPRIFRPAKMFCATRASFSCRHTRAARICWRSSWAGPGRRIFASILMKKSIANSGDCYPEACYVLGDAAVAPVPLSEKRSRNCDRRQSELRQFRQHALVSERGSAAGRRRRRCRFTAISTRA